MGAGDARRLLGSGRPAPGRVALARYAAAEGGNAHANGLLAQRQTELGHLEAACETWPAFLDDYATLASARADEHFDVLRRRIRPHLGNAKARELNTRAREMAEQKALRRPCARLGEHGQRAAGGCCRLVDGENGDVPYADIPRAELGVRKPDLAISHQRAGRLLRTSARSSATRLRALSAAWCVVSWTRMMPASRSSAAANASAWRPA